MRGNALICGLCMILNRYRRPVHVYACSGMAGVSRRWIEEFLAGGMVAGWRGTFNGIFWVGPCINFGPG
jgi:hypothetical protein